MPWLSAHGRHGHARCLCAARGAHFDTDSGGTMAPQWCMVTRTT